LYKSTLITTTLSREFSFGVVGLKPGVKDVKKVGYNYRSIANVIESNMHVRNFVVQGAFNPAEYLSKVVGIARSLWG
jgi:hypothetical protein